MAGPRGWAGAALPATCVQENALPSPSRPLPFKDEGSGRHNLAAEAGRGDVQKGRAAAPPSCCVEPGPGFLQQRPNIWVERQPV